MSKEIDEITCYSVQEWRAWLRKNHKREERVILVRYKKHTGKKSFNQREAMDEAICFGWIDTTIKRLSDAQYGVTFVKRKKTSKWSDNTFARARGMIKQKRMSKFGLEMFKQGEKYPVHDHGIPKNPDMPEELRRELKAKGLLDKFNDLAPSCNRMYYRWILSGKRAETREKRVKATVSATGKEELLGKKDL
jgi:uncharacterized protein YdeI (YjbR/CyaY-like superfamily)